MSVPPQPQSSAAFAILQLHRIFFLPDHADEIHECLSLGMKLKSASSQHFAVFGNDPLWGGAALQRCDIPCLEQGL
jgi:hypothetical protein